MAAFREGEVFDVREMKHRLGIKQTRTVINKLKAMEVVPTHWGKDCDMLTTRMLCFGVERGNGCEDDSLSE